jgi:hypothetical protein
MILLFRVTLDFRGAKSVAVDAGRVTNTESGPRPRRLASRATKFL